MIASFINVRNQERDINELRYKEHDVNELRYYRYHLSSLLKGHWTFSL